MDFSYDIVSPIRGRLVYSSSVWRAAFVFSIPLRRTQRSPIWTAVEFFAWCTFNWSFGDGEAAIRVTVHRRAIIGWRHEGQAKKDRSGSTWEFTCLAIRRLRRPQNSMHAKRFRFVVLFSAGLSAGSVSHVIAVGSARSLSNIWRAIIAPQMISG
jgi:hypothetical protein